MLPLRREGEGGPDAPSGLLDEGRRRHGRRDRQRRDPAFPQGGPRADALQPLRRLHRPLPARLSRRDRHPGVRRAGRAGEVPGRDPAHQGAQPATRDLRARLHAPLRGARLPAQHARRGGRHRLHQALPGRPRSGAEGGLPARDGGQERPQGRDRGRGSRRGSPAPTTSRSRGTTPRSSRAFPKPAGCSATGSPSTGCRRTSSTSR